jgi:hypothetical protein
MCADAKQLPRGRTQIAAGSRTVLRIGPGEPFYRVKKLFGSETNLKRTRGVLLMGLQAGSGYCDGLRGG